MISLNNNVARKQDVPKQGVLTQAADCDAFRAGERRINAKITLAEQGIGASLARLRRELAMIRWMLVGVFAAVSLVPLVMPFVA
jgi:hypothetical protein